MVCAFARVLNVPECYFYTVDDSFAEALLKLYDGEVVQWNMKTGIDLNTNEYRCLFVFMNSKEKYS